MKKQPMEDVTIRPAVFEDFMGVSALFEQVERVHAEALPDVFQQSDGPTHSQEWFAQIVVSEDTALFVAEQQGRLVGMVLCQERSSPAFLHRVPRRYAHIGDVVVHESFQGQGIGRLLMQRVDEWAHERGLTDIELNVYEFNEAAHMLYERLGYQTLRRTMRRRLPSADEEQA